MENKKMHLGHTPEFKAFVEKLLELGAKEVKWSNDGSNVQLELHVQKQVESAICHKIRIRNSGMLVYDNDGKCLDSVAQGAILHDVKLRLDLLNVG